MRALTLTLSNSADVVAKWCPLPVSPMKPPKFWRRRLPGVEEYAHDSVHHDADGSMITSLDILRTPIAIQVIAGIASRLGSA